MKMILAYDIDVQMPLVTQSPVTLLQEGDRAAHVIQAKLTEDGQPFAADGLSVSGFFLKADGVRVLLSGSASGSVLTCELEDDCYTVPGPFAVWLRMGQGHTQRTVLRLTGRVEAEGTGPVVDTGHTIPTPAEFKAMMEEIERTEQTLRGAAGAAQAATGRADSAAGRANSAAGRANGAAQEAEAWGGAEMALTVIPHGQQPAIEVTAGEAGQKKILIKMPMGPAGATPTISVQAQTGAPGTEARVEMTGTTEAPILTFVIPQGLPGSGSVSTVCGVQPDGKGNVALTAAQVKARPDTWMPTAAQVGARPDNWMPTAQQVGARPDNWTPTARDVGARADDWMPTAQQVGAATSSAVSVTLTAAGWQGAKAPYTQTVSAAGVLATDKPVADVLLDGLDAAGAGKALEAWAMIGRMQTAAGSVTATCYTDKPTVNVTAQLLIVRG